MNTKRLALFVGAALVAAVALVYLIWLYPPGSSRSGQGAIGNRNVYRAEQPADASVTSGAAPVVVQATLEKIKNHQIPELQNGQMFTLSNGYAYSLNNGQIRY